MAREEFLDLDATDRGTISIGRRLQDPLSELVKIEPQHLGVGMYQHDVNPRRLKESLEAVVESCVNFVGVDLNTASASLLRHVAGLNQLIARRIVEGGLSVRQAEALAQAPERGARRRRPPTEKDADTLALEKLLADVTGLTVVVSHRGGGGEVRIAYRSLEQLDDLCRRLRDSR